MTAEELDAGTRAELAALRRRAYGHDADITGDPVALERLIELEALALQDPHLMVDSAHALAPVGSAAGPESGTRDSTGRPPTHDPEPEVVESNEAVWPVARSAAAPWRRTIAVGIAAVIGVGIGVGMGVGMGEAIAPAETATPTPVALPAEGSSFRRDQTTKALYEIPLDRPMSTDGDPAANHAPAMPTSATVEWAEPLGSYYGWELWIAGTSGWLRPEHCILLHRGSRSEGRCGPETERSPRSLVVDLDYEDIGEDEKPAGMTQDQRIGFWWLEDSAITVLIGP
jgi:hypothetical protein